MLEYKLQFWAREPIESRESDFQCCTRFITHNERLFTPFSGTYKNISDAKRFIYRNGEFWKNRGVHLQLFKGHVHISLKNLCPENE